MGKVKKSPDEMTFLEHLEDLRKRLIWSLIVAVFVALIPAFIFAKPFYVLAQPVTQ